jgi:DNA-binding LytR/AlgR family response regulator
MEKIKLLIVEDEIIIALDLAARLEGMGYTIAGSAPNGEEALRLYRHQQIDLVLMDILLPGDLDGIEVARQMKALYPVPLIYLSAQADDFTLERAKTTFPSAYLTKPFDEASLRIAIELALHNFAFQKTALPQTQPAASDEAAEKISLHADNILRTEAAIFIKQNYKFVKLRPEDLLYCQADGAYTDLLTREKKYTLRLGLQQVIEKLHYPPLVRVHRSYAINRLRIEAFTEQAVTLGGHEIPIGASYREAFLSGFEFS